MLWQVLAIAIGIAVMAAPDLLGLSGAVADAFHILGPIAVLIGGMAVFAVLRGVRRAHLLVGPAIAVAPIVLGGGMPAIAVGVVAGLALATLAFPGGARPGQFDGGWPAVFDSRNDR